MSEWISVEERMPEEDVLVYVLIVERGFSRVEVSARDRGHPGGWRTPNITHWRPRPEEVYPPPPPE